MYAFRIGLVALFSLFPARLFAQDITVYGGQIFNGDFDNSVTSFAVGAGFDLPKTKQLLGMDQIRADFTYTDRDFSQSFRGVAFPQPPGAMPPFPEIDYQIDTQSKSYYFHVGPNWRAENVLGPVNFSVGIQAGLTHSNFDRIVFEDGVLAPNSPLALDGSSTNFSYQFPVEMEIPLTERISINARYRPIGVIYDGDNSFQHVVEGGIRIKF